MLHLPTISCHQHLPAGGGRAQLITAANDAASTCISQPVTVVTIFEAPLQSALSIAERVGGYGCRQSREKAFAGGRADGHALGLREGEEVEH